jgi:hypothetical protein
VDKSPKQRTVLAKEWWPGTESNHRHADFQGVTRESCNQLSSVGVSYREVLAIRPLTTFVYEGLPANTAAFATANHSKAVI